MCKIAIMAGLDPKNINNNWEFIQELGALMTKGNDDGLGYSAVRPDGKLFGERWLNNHHAFDLRTNTGGIVELYKGFLKGSKEPVYNSFGELSSEITAITLHTRMATSSKGMNNVHPFVDIDMDTSVIHNGIINNVTTEDNIRSTCDSERILNKYLEHGIMKHPSRIQSMVDDLKGYFACGIISRDEQGLRIIDIFKSRAKLGAVFVKELGCMVFTTDVSLVYSVAKEYNYTVLYKFEVEEDVLLRLDAITGVPILSEKYRDTASHTVHSNYGSHHRQYDHRNGTSEREVNKSKSIMGLVESIDKTKKTASTYDPLNETEAAKDGYTKTTDGIWMKRKSVMN